MPPLPQVTPAEMIRVLEQVGWIRMSQSGSHAKFRHPTRRGRVIVAVHGGRTIPVGTLRSILRQAGITPDELRDLL
jgi:predicted RNA binding protein YcfA (HicA-like mRNA interferase family)